MSDLKHMVVRFTVVAVITVALLLMASTPIGDATGAPRAKGCRTNIDLINAQIELYYANTGSWPATLDVVTNDTAYFPDGPPVCPVTGAEYNNTLTAEHRFDDSGHTH